MEEALIKLIQSKWVGNIFSTCAILILLSGCTVKAVGDPNRPITINAHITLDIKGLEETALDIEDYVSGEDDTNVEDLSKE
ncbi:MAG: hypothetical protein ACI9F2_000512 [Lysobacterales bacterium]|jgi:hypothetical protein